MSELLVSQASGTRRERKWVDGSGAKAYYIVLAVRKQDPMHAPRSRRDNSQSRLNKVGIRNLDSPAGGNRSLVTR